MNNDPLRVRLFVGLMTWSFVLFAVLSSVYGQGPGTIYAQKPMLTRVKPPAVVGPHASVVRSRHRGYAGSGGVIWANGKNAIVATAAHVIRGYTSPKNVQAISPNGKTFVGKQRVGKMAN